MMKCFRVRRRVLLALDRTQASVAAMSARIAVKAMLSRWISKCSHFSSFASTMSWLASFPRKSR